MDRGIYSHNGNVRLLANGVYSGQHTASFVSADSEPENLAGLPDTKRSGQRSWPVAKKFLLETLPRRNQFMPRQDGLKMRRIQTNSRRHLKAKSLKGFDCALAGHNL